MTTGIPTQWGHSGEDIRRVPVKLVAGEDFMCQIEPPAGENFPAGTAVRIAFFVDDEALTPFTSWAAVVSPSMAEVIQQSTVADMIPAETYTRVYLSYPDTPTADYCLTVGPVARY